MEDLNFWYPALLFPAIPLMMITFGNRYSSLSRLIRELHDKALLNNDDNYSKKILTEQIELLTDRLFLVKSMQTLAGLAFIANLLTIFFRSDTIKDFLEIIFLSTLGKASSDIKSSLAFF